MSYKLENLTFMSKAARIKLVDFVAHPGKFVNIFIPDKKQKRFMKKLLQGHEKIARGRYQVDGSDLIGGKFVKSKTVIIGPDFWFERLIPPRVILNFSSLFSANFLRQARIKKNDKKYNYFSFADSKNDLSDMELRTQIDEAISDFLDSFSKIEMELIQDFRNKVNQFHQTQIQQIFKSYYAQIQVLAQEYAYLELKIRTNNLLLTFFQALWDQIYGFNDLRGSCPCEYNVDKSSNKQVKKLQNKFTYRQAHYMVKKRLKMIGIRISELRFNLYREKKLAKQILKQLRVELKKFNVYNNIPKSIQNELQTNIGTWRKIFDDLIQTFDAEQKSVFYETLPQEGKMVKRKIIFLTHQYHTKVLSGSNELGNPNEFKILKKHYRAEIEGIYQQASQWSKDNLAKLNIKFDWYLKNGFKLSSINIIYLKLLKSINMRKSNIIFSNTFSLLTQNDYHSLMKTLYLINQKYPQLTFINLTDNLQMLTTLNQKFYTVNQQAHLKLFHPSSVFEFYARYIQEKLPAFWTTLPYIKADHGITLENVFWPMKPQKLKDAGRIIINPFMVSLEEQIGVNNQLPLIVKVKKVNKFLDKRMVLGVTKKGQKILFYTKKHLELNKEIVIFLQPNSIAGNI